MSEARDNYKQGYSLMPRDSDADYASNAAIRHVAIGEYLYFGAYRAELSEPALRTMDKTALSPVH